MVMEKWNPSNLDWLPRAQQLFDSALPTGAYAHSQGLEGMVQEGWIRNMSELKEFLVDEVAASLIQCDLPVFRETFRAVFSGRQQEILELDRLAHALRPTFELRQCGSRIGRQLWRMYDQLIHTESEERKQLHRCGEFLEMHQVVVVTAILSAIMEVEESFALSAYCRQAVVNIVQPCIKLLTTGPAEVQEVIFDVSAHIPCWVEASLIVDLGSTGTASPYWDIASSRHQFAERRLFLS